MGSSKPRAASDESASAAEIEHIAVRLEAAFNASDAVALASLYGVSACLMPPNEPMVTGRPAIQAWFERVLPRLGRVRVVPLESTAAGDQAFQAGTFISTSKPTDSPLSADGRDTTRAGKYVLLLKSREGRWEIQYDIWSLDQASG